MEISSIIRIFGRYVHFNTVVVNVEKSLLINGECKNIMPIKQWQTRKYLENKY